MIQSVSLLYKAGKSNCVEEKLHHVAEALIDDLNINRIVEFLFPEPHCKKKAAFLDVLLNLETDIETINYRLDITEELLTKTYLPGKIIKITEQAQKLANTRKVAGLYHRINPYKQLSTNAEQLLQCLELLRMLADILQDKDRYRSEGLQNLASCVVDYVMSEDYHELVSLLEQLRVTPSGAFSLKLLLNRDFDYRLRYAVLLDIVEEEVELGSRGKGSFFHGILGRRERVKKLVIDDPLLLQKRCVQDLAGTLLLYLGSIIANITANLIRFFRNLEKELLFYQAVIEMLQRLNALGLPTCRPQFVPKEFKQFQIIGIYDLSFALYLDTQGNFTAENIVRNDILMNNEAGQIFIVTGPNQGGKTTYLRAIGQTQLWAQAGIFVPAECAIISPVDHIFTHFSTEESTINDLGRFEEEILRLEQIMQVITGDSLLLMNESFSSTNAHEGASIAEEILRVLSLAGTRVVFVTHLYELAKRIDQINASTQGKTRLVSMVAGIEQLGQSDSQLPVLKRTYRVLPGEPLATSFASDVAY